MNNVCNSEHESQRTTRKRLEISVVEGSFRRIAGIREFVDASGTFLERRVEILREPGKSLGFYIQQGDGWKREDGVFVSRINLGSIVETNGLLGIGDEITKVNGIDVTRMPLGNVAVIMRYVERLLLTVKVLTSHASVRTYSLHMQKNTPRVNSSAKVYSNSGGIPSCIQPRTRNIPPFATNNNDTNNEGVVPYAYTRIGGTTHEESPGYATIRVNMEPSAAGYATIGHVPTPETGQRPREDHISTTESHTNKQTEETDVTVIDTECIDKSLDTQSYCGHLKLSLHTIDNLIPPSDNSPLVCSIACDAELTVEVTVPADQLEGEVKVKQEYHIQLCQSGWVSFTFVNGLLSSTKRFPLSYFIPDTHTVTSEQCFSLTLDPIGRLNFTVSHSPLPTAIPRWSSPTADRSTLKDLVASNPGRSGLPLIIERSIQVIQGIGIETVGLYQLTASQGAKREALSVCLSEALHLSQLRSIGSQLTVHAFTGVLKDFFLNLPEPIFDTNFTASLQDAMQLELSGERSGQAIPLYSFIECLPNEIHATTCAILSHLRNVCQQGPINKTTVDKISQIFAPLLFTPAHTNRDSAEEISSGNFTTHAQILKALILENQ